MDGVITQMKIISGTNRINYRTVESELFPKKRADWISSLGCNAKFCEKLSSLYLSLHASFIKGITTV